MAKDGLKILDSDMHIMEPADLWERYIEKNIDRAHHAASLAATYAICAWPTPMAASGETKQPIAIAPTAATTLSAIKALIDHTLNAAGLPDPNSKQWISKASISLYSIQHAG